MSQSANRKGVKFTLKNYVGGALALSIPYVNSFAVDLAADRVYATGGWNGARQVGFDDPYQGTITLSTQIIPVELIALGAGAEGYDATTVKEMFRIESLTLGASGKATLAEAPKTSTTVYCYEAGTTDLTNATAMTATFTGKELTVTDGSAGDKVDVYYITETTSAKPGESVTFNNSYTNGFYVLDGNTKWKDTNGVDIYETIKGYKVQPQRAFSITYNGTGDPLTLDIVLDLYEDETGNVYTSTRV